MAQDQQGDTIESQAVHWVLRRRQGSWTAADQTELDAWLELGPEQRGHYQRAEALWDRFGRLQGMEFPALAAARGYRRRLIRRRLLRAGTGGLAAAALLLALRWPVEHGSDSYRTGIGQRSAVTLADGSKVDLNTDSGLRVHFSRDRRQLELLRGEAYIAVAPDPARPFSVRAGSLEIADIGTRFNVRMETGRTQITVAAGAVSVSGPDARNTRINAGFRGVFGAAGALQAAGPVDANAASAWREGRLVFERRPLAEVLDEVARYHPVRWEFADPELGRLTLTGSFESANLPGFLAALQAVLPVRTESLDDGRIRLSRASLPSR